MSYEEQIMAKDKYPSIFSPQMVTIVFIILQIFLGTRAVLKLGNIKHLMTGPLGNSEFCFPRISMFPETKLFCFTI